MAKKSQKSRRKILGKKIDLQLPHWGLLFYVGCAALLLPWTIALSLDLPTREVSRHWDVAWGGFDIYVLILLLLSAYFVARKSIWIVVSASALACALLTDAWFDILTAKSGSDQQHSILLAIFAELPVMIISLYFAIQAVRQYIRFAQQ